MARALKLPEVIDGELPPPGSGRGYKSSQFVMPLILMLHGGGKRLEDLREVKGEVSLRELLEMNELPASCTVGDWLRRMGKDGRGLLGLGWVSDYREEPAAEVVSIHNQRGQVEKFIKELKDGFGMNWMPCGEMYANAVFFRIGG